MNTENLNKQPEPVLKALANLEKVKPVEELEEKIYNRLDPRLFLDWFSFSKAGTFGIAVLIVISTVLIFTESSQQVKYFPEYDEKLETIEPSDDQILPAVMNSRSSEVSRKDRITSDTLKVELNSGK